MPVADAWSLTILKRFLVLVSEALDLMFMPPPVVTLSRSSILMAHPVVVAGARK